MSNNKVIGVLGEESSRIHFLIEKVGIKWIGGIRLKLLVLDVKGTIFKAKYKIEGTDYASTMWQPLAKALGEDAIKEELASHEKWDNKEYKNYMSWVEETAMIHKK